MSRRWWRLVFAMLLACDAGETSSPLAEPPFAVRGDCKGLMLVYFDAEGAHTVERRDEIPAAHREHVRVDSLQLEPGERLDPEQVYLADLREEKGGRYPVQIVERAAFDALVEEARGGSAVVGAPSAAHAEGEVIIYGADWCGVCKQAARYFRGRGIAFIEKNIEKDPAAHAEMQAKARAAGVSTTGIPVIDVRGTLLAGFNQGAIEAALGK